MAVVESDPRRGRARIGVGAKFSAVVAVLVPAVLAVALVGAAGLARIHRDARVLTDERLRTVQDSANLVSAAYQLHETALLQIAGDSAAMDAEVNAELDQILIPGFHTATSALRRDYSGRPADLARVDAIEAGLEPYVRLRQTRLFASAQTHNRTALSPAERGDLAERVDVIFTALVEAGEALRAQEATRAGDTRREADTAFRSTLLELAAGVLTVLALTTALVLALIRNLVPRIRMYSRYATHVAQARSVAPLDVRGRDELADLGQALNAMVRHREQVSTAEAAQSEFVDTLQVTGSEDEAQELVRRHLERSVPGSSVVVLRRNNSANRLESATAIPAGDDLAARLVGAEPRACAALRVGKTHREGTERPPLLQCTVCADRDRPSVCEPLLVGGEVIGSVLVTHDGTYDPGRDGQVRNTVAQAAPMLANLRNLALAEFRANNDALTGLPNKRATDDTLKRMVAQASRSVTPLTAIMLDLDHFKQINDRFGHGKGDEVLAAVGTTINACLRAGDFAGRFGGEEFLVLLPDTAAQAALIVAERIRVAITAVTIVGVERDITASLGIADLLEHAGSAEGLIHEADRALYTAKTMGRNRVATATTHHKVAQNDPPGSSRTDARPGD